MTRRPSTIDTPADCPCGTHHRSWRTAARCRYPDLNRFTGSGPWWFVHRFAVPISQTRREWRTHVTAYPTRELAEAEAARLPVPCSGTCRAHLVDYLPGSLGMRSGSATGLPCRVVADGPTRPVKTPPQVPATITHGRPLSVPAGRVSRAGRVPDTTPRRPHHDPDRRRLRAGMAAVVQRRQVLGRPQCPHLREGGFSRKASPAIRQAAARTPQRSEAPPGEHRHPRHERRHGNDQHPTRPTKDT